MIRRTPRSTASGHALISPLDWRRPSVRWGVGAGQVLLLIGLIVIGLGPLFWLANSEAAQRPRSDSRIVG